jgi:hypothetical protein
MKAVIDRIENDMAVILLGEDEISFDLPLQYLPDGVQEGTWLRVDFKIDDHTTRERFRQNKFLLDKLKSKHADSLKFEKPNIRQPSNLTNKGLQSDAL